MPTPPKPAVFTFPEAISLLDVGVTNFLFRNGSGDLFHCGFDHSTDRPVINMVTLRDLELAPVNPNKLT